MSNSETSMSDERLEHATSKIGVALLEDQYKPYIDANDYFKTIEKIIKRLHASGMSYERILDVLVVE